MTPSTTPVPGTPDPYDGLPANLVALLRDPRITVPGHLDALEKVHEWAQRPVNSAATATYVTDTDALIRPRRITGDTP